MSKTDLIIKKIIKWNNIYRARNTTNKQKLEALWKIGDYLYSVGIKNPHSLGWEIQDKTKGMIKRPTIFRSYKLRTIWPTLEKCITDCGKVTGLSNIIEMLPLLDPEQKSKRKIPLHLINKMKANMIQLSPSEFKKQLDELKNHYKDERLGQRLDKSRHLSGFKETVLNFYKFKKTLESAIISDIQTRDKLRTELGKDNLRAFSNMCISLTTKENIKLYKYKNKKEIFAGNKNFENLFKSLSELLDEKSDTKRARLRRLISALEFAELSDLSSSITDEGGVKDYIQRKKISVPLK